jgi:hypothetical protein
MYTAWIQAGLANRFTLAIRVAMSRVSWPVGTLANLRCRTYSFVIYTKEIRDANI